jgi:His-Xaa-Ser system protein HxsD
MAVNFPETDIISVVIDASVYSKEAILKCLYWYSSKFDTEINFDGSNYLVSLTPLENSEIIREELPLYREKLKRDILDYELRQIIHNETINIRELIVAKAFSHGEYDQPPVGSIADPIGFDPI